MLRTKHGIFDDNSGSRSAPELEVRGLRSSAQRHARRDGDAPATWRDVDRALHSIAQQRGGLDGEEAPWLVELERLEIWREVGMVSALDYLERVMGYGPRAAQERLRVARALANLPLLASALARGAVHYSAVRELTRVALPATEQEWLAHAAGRNLRQIEQLVAGRKAGDRPGDHPHPELVMQRVFFELTPAAFAVLQQARHDLDVEHGARMTDSEFVEAAHTAPRTIVDGNADADGDSEISGRAKFQVLVVRCDNCNAAWQDGGGVRMPLDATTVERAACDAQIIDARDGTPGRATEDIPTAMKRFVWRRDGGHCQTPGCRSRRALEIHHIQHREHGGDHAPSNLTLRCFRCHQSHHAGLITIGGTAPGQLTLTRRFDVTGGAPVGATPPDASVLRAPVGATRWDASPPRAPVGATSWDASALRAPVGAIPSDASRPCAPVSATRSDASALRAPVSATRSDASPPRAPVGATPSDASRCAPP